MKEKILKLFTSPAFRDVWRWSKNAHKPLLLISVLSIVTSCMGLVITLATRGLIDGASSGQKSMLIGYAVMLSGAVILSRIVSYFISSSRVKTSASMLRELRRDVLKSILTREYASMDHYHSGDLVNRLFSDANSVNDGIMNIVPSLASMATALIGACVILIAMDWRFVALLVIGGCVGLLLIAVFRTPMQRRHKAMKESESKLHIILQETLSNLRLIKASGSENRMEYQTEEKQEAYSHSRCVSGLFSVKMNMIIGSAFQISYLITMLWGGIGIYHGTLTYGMLAAIIQLVGQIQSPIAGIADVASLAYGTLSSAERLKELIDLPGEDDPAENPGQAAVQNDFSSISVENVNFCYERGVKVIENADLVIRRGEFVAITGRSGGGKSTLFQLLMGIYNPVEGSVKFNYEDHSEIAGRKTRRLFAYVPQGNTLFSGTIGDNIAMFTDAPTHEQIRGAARSACIADFIEGLKDGYDTVIGEHGIGLSEGQAQRIAVARALLSNAPILLLDESTSALDEQTEAQLLKNIAQLKDKTCLIVTHRRAALSICDYAIEIEDSHVCRTELSPRL